MTTVIGVLFLSHGIFWALVRLVRPQMSKRGYILAQRLGVRSSAVYFACFVFLPLVIGVLLLTAGMSGYSLSDTVQ
jgi:hypothetical protein